MSHNIIVVGGGLSGLSAAHTILQAGGNVVLVDKNAFLGGNSTKATSGINGALTITQQKLGIPDSKEQFEEDTIRSATGIKTGPCPPPYPLGKTLTHESGPAVEWLIESFGLMLNTVSRLGGHSHPRTHRRADGATFPGMMITYKLMGKLDEIAKADPTRARIITKARVFKLIKGANGAITGVQYRLRNGQEHTESADGVVVCTGGYGAGVLSQNSYLSKVRPDLMHLPTTNGEHCTGDAMEFCGEVGAAHIDAKYVQVHPTGLINPKDPDNRVKFLAAGALRGEGGIILDREGNRFCNELGTRDYVTGRMWEHNKGPYHLILNSAATAGIAWHCEHYRGRGVMQAKTGQELASMIGVSSTKLQSSFDAYNKNAVEGKDEYGKLYFKNAPFNVNDNFNVGIVTPVVHYSMGGLAIDTDGQILDSQNNPIAGLFGAGEVTGGVHGKNRLGGSALLECVVFGRQAGAAAIKYAQMNGTSNKPSASSTVTISVPQANGPPITITVTTNGAQSASATAPGAAPAAAAESAPAENKQKMGEYTMAEVAKHTTENDCWVVVGDQVLDVTGFLSDHPGGKMAIMTFAGKDATKEFNMLHEPDVIEKFAPEVVIGKLKAAARM